ncbi:MAG: hypothetical protein WA364_08035 [Candidatus Nitrosopolaris sp.]
MAKSHFERYDKNISDDDAAQIRTRVLEALWKSSIIVKSGDNASFS